MKSASWLLTGVLGLGACSGSPSAPKTDAEYRADVVSNMHDALLVDIGSMVSAASDLQAAAPAPPDRGWDATADATAMASMKSALERARNAYEHIEGAVAFLYPDVDVALDTRYENDLARLGSAGDSYLFDDQGFVGFDAVERVLYADVTAPGVVAYEATLKGYVPAAFPATAAEAADFKTKLCGRLVRDATTLQSSWTVASIDADTAFFGLTSLVDEQLSEIARTPANAEESRYSQRTMDDLRANIEGTEGIYGIFRDWIFSKPGGADLDAKVKGSIAAVQGLYN